MSITVQQVINRALSKVGILGAGQTVSTNDNALCLEALIALLNKQVTSGTFGALTDVIPTGTTYTANENERINNNGTVIVTLPLSIALTYCDSDYGLVGPITSTTLTRPPRDLAVVEEVNTSTNVTKTSIYTNRTRTWTDINSLTYSSVCPLAQRDENGLACLLAVNIADEFGQQPSQLVTKAAYDFQLALADNWSDASEVRERRKYY